MSSRIFQGIILQMKDATDRCMGVIDDQGIVVACSELGMIGSKLDDYHAAPSDYPDQVFTSGNRTFKSIGGPNAEYDFIVFVEGRDSTARSTCILAAVAFQEARVNYEEKHNKTIFVKNIISDNILPGDIYVRAKALHFSTDTPRAVLLIRQIGHTDMAALEVVSGMFPDRQRDFVLSVNETDIVLIKELTSLQDNNQEVYDIARAIEEKLMSELNIRCVIGIGTTVQHLRVLADKYKEAQVAIEVGKVFDTEKSIIHYDNLGIGRLIYQLPNTLCEMFLSEVFKKNPIEALDQETLYTINKFFENNLNVSETSRKLFVHRNTLVYRLEKIKKLTGLDLREFDHAIIFKVGLMVKKYLNSQSGEH